MEKGKTKSSRSAMWRPKSNDGFELVFSGYGSDLTCSSQFLDRRPGVETQWYVIKVPYPDSNPDPEREPDPEPDFVSYFTSSKPKKAKGVHHPGRLNPISVADHLYENKHNAVLAKTHLYSFGNVRSSIDVDCLIPHKEVSTLDVNCVADGWKFVPPMASPRYCPHTVVLDGKLYVFGGFETASSLRGSGWMEVFDPNTKKWTSLPNPPTEISEHEMIYGVVEPKKVIFLSDLRYPYAFQTYDVKSKAWTARRSAYPFEIFSNGVHPRATTVGNTLFWVSLVWDSFENLDGCCVHAYRMDDGSDSGDVYFKGSFDIDRMVELDNGVTAKYPPGGLHHLGDQKFCFLLTTLSYERGKTSSYVNCLILDISPTCDEDGEGHNKLNISIMSNHKYSVPSYFTLLDSLLL